MLFQEFRKNFWLIVIVFLIFKCRELPKLKRREAVNERMNEKFIILVISFRKVWLTLMGKTDVELYRFSR